MAIRLGVLPRLALVAFLVIFILHFLSTSLGPREEFADDDPNWSERLGLDHYADWEAGVADRLGDGMDKVRDSLGVIKGGLGWGVQGTRLGSLYELILTSNPSPGPAYFDERTSLDRLRLSSTRVLGHSSGNAPDDADDDDSTTPANRRHILVTGGFGSMGKHVVRDLLLGLNGHKGRTNGFDEWTALDSKSDEEDILITLLDVDDRSSELNHLLQSAPISTPLKVKGTDPRAQAFTSSERTVSSFKRKGKLRIILGDVRDQDLIKSLLLPAPASETQTSGSGFRKVKLKNHVESAVLIPPVSGIIHLAAYSPSACRVNPMDCADVEMSGMEAILNGLERDGESGAIGGRKALVAERPWLIMPRRGEAWAEIPNAYHANASTESMVESHRLLKQFASKHPIHSLLLQLPSSHSIIGDPYTPRFDPIPHIVESALGDLPVQVYTLPDNMHDSFLAIDDAAQSIIQGARMLELSSKKLYLRSFAFVAELEVVGPGIILKSKAGPLAELAKATIAITQSLSPFAEVLEGTHDPTESADRVARMGAMRKTLTKALGFTPTITIRSALKTYILSLLALQSTYLTKQVNIACSTAPSIPVLEEGLLGLSGCNVQLLTVIEGAYFTLGCSAGLEGKHDTPVALVGAIPFKEGVRGVEVLAERGMEGKVDLQFRCPVTKDGKLTGESDIVVWADTTDGGEFSEAKEAGPRTIAEWYTVDFASRDARSFTLTLPPTEGVAEGDEPKRRLTLKDLRGSYKSLIFQAAAPGEARPMQWRINPICCPANDRRKDLWDYFKEDPVITSQVSFPSEDGRTSLSESTLSMQRCKALRAEHDRIVKLRKAVKDPEVTERCEPVRGEASLWEAKDLQICHNDCSAPIVCLASETCKCTRDRCGDPRARGPFPAVAYSERRSFSAEKAEPVTLAQRVASIPWESIILPGARRAFATPLVDLPQVHVVDLPDTIDTHMQQAACYNIDKSPLPFMGDHFLVEALRNQSVGIEEADFVLVPYFQGCYYNYLQENTFKKLADTVGFAETRIAAADHISASKIAIPFTHDFGSCTGWWPRLEDVLGRSPPSPMDQAIAWQVNGDYNTRCVKPDRDVVMPAVSKLSKALASTFKSIDKITPVSKRKHLAFFAGGVRGFGAVARTRIGCGRTSQDAKTAKVLYQQFAEGERYLGTLNQAKFCLLPRGIPAWSTRTFEAIYAGCIPAFVVDRNIFPFQDILDYSLFSVSIPENEAHRVEEYLATFTEAQMFELQAHVLRVREVFLFKEGEEWERKGPLFFSLVSMAMRLYLGYPAVGGCASQLALR
ncbi:Proteophosphoglycan ppg4 [Meredithblackwellia eburnea MCA 4105]